MATFTGTTGDDNLHGTNVNDVFHLEDGGDDTALGGHGSDTFYLGGALAAGDRINGGEGIDAVVLDGDYSAGLAVTGAMLVSVEYLSLVHGHDYDLTLSNSLVAPDGSLTVRGDFLHASDHLTVDASAIDHGRVTLLGSAGDDLLIGSSAGTSFDLSNGGADTAVGGAGDDSFGFNRQFSADVHVDGGGGRDSISFKGADAPILLDGDAIRSIEVVHVIADSISIVVADAFLKPGRLLLVDSQFKTEGFSFDGSAETDGRFELHGGRADHLIGGAMGDTIFGGFLGDTIQGGGGADVLDGGAGHDWFVCASTADSAVGAADTIIDLDNGDIIDLSAIDADTTQAGDQKFHLVGAFTHHAGQLVLVAGDGVTQLLADVDGDGVADMQVDLQGDHGDFTHFKF